MTEDTAGDVTNQILAPLLPGSGGLERARAQRPCSGPDKRTPADGCRDRDDEQCRERHGRERRRLFPSGHGRSPRALRNCSTSSTVRGTPADSRSSPDPVNRYESSMRTPMFLYFSTTGLTLAANAVLAGVLGRSSSAASRM